MGKIHTIASFICGFALATIFYSHVHLQQTYSIRKDDLGYARSGFVTIPNNNYPPSHPLDEPNDTENNDRTNLNGIANNDQENEGEEGLGGKEVTEENRKDVDMDICSILNSQTSMKTWSQNIHKIFPASRHTLDEPDIFLWHDFTAMLLNFMTPQRLSMSVKNSPSMYWDQVGHILDVAWERFRYLQNNENGDTKNTKASSQKTPPPRKVSILVMGGSVTMGVQCASNPVEETSRFARRGCAWPTRLQILLDALFPGVVELNMVTLGGTNTESAITIWDYSLYPEQVPHPDIIIHAYSTNDMHVLSEIDAKKRGVTLEDMILEVNQKFIRLVLGRGETLEHQCHRPTSLLFYFDDYVGNEQRELLKTNAFSKSIHTLSNYYGFGYVSYADAVRHLVYGDTDENWFSPHGWPERQVHPGMGMHISSAWVMAFNFLHTATAFCDRLEYLDTDVQFSTVSGIGELKYTPTHGLPKLKQSDKKLEGAPHLLPNTALPPELNMNLTLDSISPAWRNALKSTPKFDRSLCQNTLGDNHNYRPCIFSWVGGLEKGFDKKKPLVARMKPVLKANDGWEANDENGKLGFAATKDKASFELEFVRVKQTIRTLNFMVMTSYGEKWADSRILVEAFVDKNDNNKNIAATTPVKTMQIVGFHDKKTSETYNYKLDLGDDTSVGDSLRARITLVGGTTFKFMGMAICDH